MTLIELIIAMAILLVIIGAIVDSFASATKAETDQIARADAQSNARLSLETMRRDIHCATTANTSVTGVLTLGQPALPCAGPTATSTVVWCTTGSPGRYMLRRNTTSTCGASSMPKADYLVTNAVWSNASCVAGSGRNRAIAVDLQISVTERTPGPNTYRLQDAITLRNGSLC